MRKLLPIVFGVLTFGCSEAKIAETESFFLCEGEADSIIRGLGGPVKTSMSVFKFGDQVVRVKYGDSTFTRDKLDVRGDSSKAPVYKSLLVEGDKMILRTEVTADKLSYDTIIERTGVFNSNRGLFGGLVTGKCSPVSKTF